MICGPFRAPVLGPMPGSSGTCGQGYCSSRTQFWLMGGPWGSASPPLLLSEAYLRFKGLPFSMAVECDSLLPPHPSVAMHFTIWAGKGPGAFASCLLASLPPSSLPLPLPIWHPPVASPSFLPCSSSSCLLLSPYLLSVFVSTLSCLDVRSCLFLSPCPGIGDSHTLRSPPECPSGPPQILPCGMDLLRSCFWGSRTRKPFCWELDSL